MTISEFRKLYRHPKYTTYGSYPVFAWTTDGVAICWDCMKTERRNILESIANNYHDGWGVAGMEVNWEDTDMYCYNCGDQIESAYGDDE